MTKGPAFLDPERRPAIRRVILASLHSKLELPYWILSLLVAAWMAWREYARDTLPYLPCEDGHCPDPGTREWLHALRIMNEQAWDHTMSAFTGVLVFAIVLRIAAFIWGSLVVLVFYESDGPAG